MNSNPGLGVHPWSNILVESPNLIHRRLRSAVEILHASIKRIHKLSNQPTYLNSILGDVKVHSESIMPKVEVILELLSGGVVPMHTNTIELENNE